MTRRPTGLQGTPSPRAPVMFRLLVGLARLLNRLLFRIRMDLEGAEHLPRDAAGRPTGGWVAVPIDHRRWIDPFLVILCLPIQPRLVFFGDGRVIFLSPFRRLLFRLIGGVVPVWPRGGAAAFDDHVAAADRVLRAGAVFVFFPEAGPPAPPGESRPIKPGIGYIGLRTGAALVPMVIGGTTELYRGRRLVLRVLPPVTAADLAGVTDVPAVGSAEERSAARAVADGLTALSAPVVATLTDQLTAESAHDRKQWRWLTHWLDLEWEGDRPHRPPADSPRRRPRRPGPPARRPP